jgi:hypothetical protein
MQIFITSTNSFTDKRPPQLNAFLPLPSSHAFVPRFTLIDEVCVESAKQRRHNEESKNRHRAVSREFTSISCLLIITLTIVDDDIVLCVSQN